MNQANQFKLANSAISTNKGKASSHPIPRLLLRTLLLLLLSTSFRAGFAQEAFPIQLDDSGARKTLNSNFLRYYTTTVPGNPDDTTTRYLYLWAEGGDGGAYMRKKNSTGGGEGATIIARFPIGIDEVQKSSVPDDPLSRTLLKDEPKHYKIPPGSELRIIVGEKGAQKPLEFVGVKGMGGGGGTGVIFRKPEGFADRDWHILVVAGGGGGAYGNCCTVRHPGLPGNIGKDGTPERDDNSTQTESEQPGSEAGENGESTGRSTCPTCIIKYHGGGGIKKKNDSDPYPDNMAFQKGKGFVGGFYALSEEYKERYQDIYGGFGFGGGGTGGMDGGGGGGYSGGARGNGGGGGGSFVNSNFASKGSIVKQRNGTTSNPTDGFLRYMFSTDDPVTRSKGQSFTSKTDLLSIGPFRLVWQGDGNLVLRRYDNAIWASNTDGRGKKLVFQRDGNLVIYDANDQAIWATATADAQQDGRRGVELVLSPIGKLYILDREQHAIWSAKSK